jgi:hypothetical protein
MESMDNLGDQPPISCGFVETIQLSAGLGGYRKPCRITYTEEVTGSSPAPPTDYKTDLCLLFSLREFHFLQFSIHYFFFDSTQVPSPYK